MWGQIGLLSRAAHHLNMNKAERAYLESLYNDCLIQERECVLTFYGAGQGDLCIELLGKDRKPFRPGSLTK